MKKPKHDQDIGNCMKKLLDLLAVIHQDGGQYTNEYGLEKSWNDAMEVLPEWIHSINEAWEDSL